jgi:hypothetical protein
VNWSRRSSDKEDVSDAGQSESPEPSIFASMASGFGWGALSALAAAFGGIVGHLAGVWIYPQKYEQIPSILFFIPLGLLLGFFAGLWARLTRPEWLSGRVSIVAFSGIAYAIAMFWYANSHALPPEFLVDFEPYVARAEPCTAATCPQANPPLDWTVEGHVKIRAIRMTGNVDAIFMAAQVEFEGSPQLRRGDRFIEKESFGPKVRLTGDDIVGPHTVRSGQTVSYPIRYSYRTRGGQSRRSIVVSVEYSDTKGGHHQVWRQWEVH